VGAAEGEQSVAEGAVDEMLDKMDTPERCEGFAQNAERRGEHDRAQLARVKGVQLNARRQGAKNEVEQACWEAVLAYEQILKKKHGRAQPASYTRRMIQKRGIIAAVERTVLKKDVTVGYRALLAEGMQDMAFEAVVLRFPDAFSPAAVEQSRARLAEWQKNPDAD
jgi:hypothetical protein